MMFSMVEMTEEEAILAGLVEIWESSGSRAENQMAHRIVDRLRGLGVTAHAVERKMSYATKVSVWRDREFEKRLKFNPF